MPESLFFREICNEILCSNHSSLGESEDSVLVCSYQGAIKCTAYTLRQSTETTYG